MMPEVISVAELNSRVKELFARTPTINDVWVSGEISNLKKYPSGYYFVLKDSASEIHAVMFNNARSRIDFEPAENMKVTVFGSIGMFVPRGTYQFIVETMNKSGLGDRYLAFEALKKKLDAEGLFDKARKRKLPAYPSKIGVVTSQSGAVIHDIITTSASRYTADIILAPAMVQGDGAAETIVHGIEVLNEMGVDVIIVGRGGGSIEDLWPFNEESVARAIYNSKAPVVSAVGHETDFTIADFVADVRAPTPTGAAAIILRDKVEIRSDLQNLSNRLNRAMGSVIDGAKHSFEIVDTKLDPKRAKETLDVYSMNIDNLSGKADAALKGKMQEMRSRFVTVYSRLRPERALEDIGNLSERVEHSIDMIAANARSRMTNASSRFDSVSGRPEGLITNIMDTRKERIESLTQRIEGLNPMNVLTRGYAMITSDDGKVVTSIDKISVGDTVAIHLRDGTAEADITKKERK